MEPSMDLSTLTHFITSSYQMFSAHNTSSPVRSTIYYDMLGSLNLPDRMLVGPHHAQDRLSCILEKIHTLFSI